MCTAGQGKTSHFTTFRIALRSKKPFKAANVEVAIVSLPINQTTWTCDVASSPVILHFKRDL